MQRKLLVIATACALTGASGLAAAEQQKSAQSSPDSQTTSSQQSGVVSSKSSSAAVEGMDELQAAAQRLRESVQKMVELKAGEDRNTAMKEARKALFDTQEAMVAIAPKAISAGDGGTSDGGTASVKGAAGDEGLDRLKQAAQRLRETIQDLAQAPAGEARSAAMKQAREALIETQTAMAWTVEAR